MRSSAPTTRVRINVRWICAGGLVVFGLLSSTAVIILRPSRSPINEQAAAASSTVDIATAAATPAGATRLEILEDAATDASNQAVRRLMQVADPRHDTWETERFTAIAQQHLERFGAAIAQPEASQLIRPLISGTDFRTTSLRPPLNPAVRYQGSLLVRRPTARPPRVFHGPDGLQAAVQTLLVDIVDPQQARVAFKIVGVQRKGQQFVTDVLVNVSDVDEHRSLQRNGLWQIGWQVPANEAASTTLINSIELLDYHEAEYTASGRPMFEDVTLSAMCNTPLARQQNERGIGYWSQRLTRQEEMHFTGHHGLAVADVNQDGLPDLYVCDGGGLPNRLLLQHADGTLKDASAESGADWLEPTHAALLTDLDNDGDPDLVAVTVPALIVAENDGSGRFRIRSGYPGTSEAYSICAADFDHDADLDVYVCNYGPATASSVGQRGFEALLPVPFNDATNGGRNVLMRNEGDFQFVDVTDHVGLDQNNSRWSFAAAWEDYDNDGDQDLYVANDFGRNNLYRNDRSGARFYDVAASADVEDMAGGMSVSWGDANRDGHMDLYVGNMFSAAGQRVTQQDHWTQTREPQQVVGIQRMSRGNSLFLSNRRAAFLDVSQRLAVTMGRWAWGSKFADINNDSWPDLVVANGFLTNDKTDDL